MIVETVFLNRIHQIQESIRQACVQSHRNPDDVKIVAVSKTKPVEDIRRVFNSGLRIFGESKIQEAAEKIEACRDLDIEWHLIGHLQTNKAKSAVKLFHLIHSVDSEKLLETINQEAEKIGKIQEILLQINVSGEESKFGASLNRWESLLNSVNQSKHIRCKGLMTIPPYSENGEDSRSHFQSLRELSVLVKEKLINPQEKIELSMGMTNDYAVAVQEGATYVRIGTAIFGERHYQ